MGAPEVYAVKFGSTSTATRGRYFPATGRPDDALPLDYFVWAIRSTHGDIVVDAGWTAATNNGRPRDLLENPGTALRRIGVDPTVVEFVVLTHFHNDHVGDLDAFPAAVFVAQRTEYAFWTAPGAWESEHAHHAERADVDRLVALHAAGRLTLVDGDAEIAPGVRVVALDGHTPGSQVVVVDTARGPVVVTGDAVHYYEEVEQGSEFSVASDADALRRGVARIRDLADGGVVVPGHDPLVLARFDAVSEHDDRAVRIA